jgi:hypothetical protein
MNKILEDLMRKRKIQTGILVGLAVISVVMVSLLSIYYFTVIAQ